MKYLRPDLYAIRGWLGWTHLLVSDGEIVLMDSGFANEYRRIQRAVVALGGKPEALKAILLTHGHLDHTTNAARLQEWSGAKLYAPVGDESHITGCCPYRGATRVCGVLEKIGRAIVRYRPPCVDAWIRDGDELSFWGGLRVVALPGHTAGHVGYYSPAKRAFFVGDAFAISWRIALPPAIFSTDIPASRASFQKLAGYDVELFVPCHYFWLPRNLVARVRGKASRRRGAPVTNQDDEPAPAK